MYRLQIKWGFNNNKKLSFFLLNRAWLGQNSVSIKASLTNLTINFFDLIYYLRCLITKPLPLNHLVVCCLTNSNGFFRLSRLGIFCTVRSLGTSLLMWFWGLFLWELAGLVMMSVTVSILRSRWRLLLRMYQAAWTIHFSTLFWKRWITWMLESLAQPQS
jgi:hypothetical protein